jgi:glycine oxidase
VLSRPDVTVLGAGVIGLSLALELHKRGASVTLYEPRAAASQASWAAAGMLAAQDPFNPPALQSLARLSAALYPAFLEDLQHRSGQPVPFQTQVAVQTLTDGSTIRLQERSLDPRQLAVALAMAVQTSGIPVLQRAAAPGQVSVRGGVIVHAMGAWATAPEVFPRKGQMLRVKLPAGTALEEVHRSEHVYVVPRLHGPQAGTALIGATVEDAGFDTETVPEDLAGLRQLGAALVPHLAGLEDGRQAPIVEAWAGLRPATPDDLPLLGDLPSRSDAHGPRQVIAAGHFRNGILLAPATAALIADLLEDRAPAVDLSPFSPLRFTTTASCMTPTDQSHRYSVT